MKPEKDSQDILASLTVRSNIADQVFVFGVWLFMLITALVWLAKYGSRIPIWEDWNLVAALTGNEPNLISWLWTQNNEHRIPFPKIILLILLKITNGDFRIGMFFNVITLGAASLAMVLVARHLRGGRTSFSDAFFPIAFLHLGNWENFFLCWQVSYSIPTILTSILLLVLVSYHTLTVPIAAVIAGTSLILLPFSGANGLMIVPLMAFWLSYSGVLHWRDIKIHGGDRWISIFLIASSIIALIFSCLYLVDFHRPTWAPPSPNFLTTVKTAVKLLAFGFGPAVEKSWTLSEVLTVGFLLSSAVVLVLGLLHHKGLERQRAMGVLFFFCNLIMFALFFGWGRAVATQQGGWPTRYVIFGVQVLSTAYFIWELYGPPKLRSIAQTVLLLGMFVTLPFNMKWGLVVGDGYWQNMDAVEKDLLAGAPRSAMVVRHREWLYSSWDETKLANAMQMLHDAGVEPFVKMRSDTTMQGP